MPARFRPAEGRSAKEAARAQDSAPKAVVPALTLGPSQLCDLPASSLNDHWPQHTFRVLWAEGQAQKECVLFKGNAGGLPQPHLPALAFPPPAALTPALAPLSAPAGHQDCWSQDSVTEEQVFR